MKQCVKACCRWRRLGYPERIFSHYRTQYGQIEYWFWILANFLMGLAIGLIALISLMFIPFLTEVATLLFGLSALLAWAYSALILLPGLCVFTRRMHDTGRSFWNILWALVPVVGPIIPLIRLCEPSGPANIYGEGPNPPSI